MGLRKYPKDLHGVVYIPEVGKQGWKTKWMLMSRPMWELQQKVKQPVKEMVEERVKYELSKEEQWLPEYTGTIEKGLEKELINSLRTFKTAIMEDDTARIIEAYWEGKWME